MQLRDLTEPQLKAVMGAAFNAVRRELPPGTLFCVLAFDDPGLAQYVCNAQRPEVIRAFRETADRLERKQFMARVEF